MANVYVSNLGVNKVARNKRPYTGNAVYNSGNGGGVGIHIEHDILTDLASKTVTVNFSSEFSVIPAGWVRVYRMRETTAGNGKLKQWDVLYYHTSSDWKTKTGFSIQIDATENLTGVIVEYLFI